MFDTREEANQKLSGTVVLFNNIPTYIYEAVGKGDSLKVRHMLLRDKKEQANYLREPGWDFKTVGSKLGYTNVSMGEQSYNEGMYVTRIPVRRTQSCQGLSSHNLRYNGLKGSRRLGLSSLSINWNSLYVAPYFLDTLEGRYPRLDDLGKDFKNPWVISKAFDRSFSVRRPDVGPFYLEYKGKDIGHSDDLYRWRLAPQFDYLHETLEHLKVRI